MRASLRGQEMGFEVRWRIDPIFPTDGWQETYQELFVTAARDGHRPTRITLGTYREMQPSLMTFARGWGLPPLECTPPKLQKDGSHFHLSGCERVTIYRFLFDAIKEAWKGEVIVRSSRSAKNRGVFGRNWGWITRCATADETLIHLG